MIFAFTFMVFKDKSTFAFAEGMHLRYGIAADLQFKHALMIIYLLASSCTLWASLVRVGQSVLH